MSSNLLRNPVVVLSAMFALASLAFSSGCAVEEDSIELDEEEVETSKVAISGQINLNGAKESCNSRHRVWKNGTCLNQCAAGYLMENGTCIDVEDGCLDGGPDCWDSSSSA